MPDEPQHYSPDPTLTADQQRVLSLLAEGRSLHAVAAEVGIHRNTIRNWRRTLPAFAREIDFALREQAAAWQEQAVHLAPRATTVLYDVLNNPATPDGVRLRAALAVLKMASSPQHGMLPAPTEPSPQTTPIVHREIPKTRTIMHNAVPGRNATCPCGSGQKFKRCCHPNAPPKHILAQAVG